MRRIARPALVILALLSCTPDGAVAPLSAVLADEEAAADLPTVRISEIHYDNTGTDAGEAIEISGPAGTDLAGWTIVLYNGSGGAVYDTDPLSGTIADQCSGRGTVVLTYPSNGIQNGSPDGIALVDQAAAVVEFLSYEGTFTAVGGPANGLVSTDIGRSEAGSEPLGQSLPRNGAGAWNGPIDNTFGACNDDDEPPPPPPPPPLPETRFAELHYDNDGTDIVEAIEIEGPAGVDLDGWRVVLYNGSGGAVYDTRALGGTVVERCGGRGVVVLTYPSNGIQNGSPDGLALVDAAGAVVEFLSYEGTFTAVDGPAAGLTSTDIGAAEGSSTPLGRSLQRLGTGAWQLLAQATFGACNEGDEGPPPRPVLTMIFSGRTASDPALPVGFQDQLFATLVDARRTVVPTAFTWTSETPDVASVDQDGVVTALGPGTAILRVTGDEGSTATTSLPTRVAAASTAAQYAGNAEFGEPADGDPSDDFILRRGEFTASYSRTRGTPNWVSYDLDATHFGPEDRCDCFTFDPALPAEFPRYTTADYTGAGEFHGFGIDRGHLARSFDRTAGSLDNARTFLFTNIIPQAADQNQGPWAVLETHLGDLARFQDREVYIVAGVAGSKGTVKDEGRITIPASTWKVAVVMPRDHGLGQVTGAGDVELIAVIMPNDPGVRNVDWQTYRTTVDAVETLSGYELLALLPDHIEVTLETPVVAELAAIAASEGDQHPKLRDAQAKMEAALRELAKQPADRRSALGGIEGAVGDLEAAVKDGLSPATGLHLMDGLVGLAREFAVQAIRDARLRGAGMPRIRVAERFLQMADARRAAGRFKDAAAKYKDALAQAEGAR